MSNRWSWSNIYKVSEHADVHGIKVHTLLKTIFQMRWLHGQQVQEYSCYILMRIFWISQRRAQLAVDVAWCLVHPGEEHSDFYFCTVLHGFYGSSRLAFLHTLSNGRRKCKTSACVTNCCRKNPKTRHVLVGPVRSTHSVCLNAVITYSDDDLIVIEVRINVHQYNWVILEFCCAGKHAQCHRIKAL